MKKQFLLVIFALIINNTVCSQILKKRESLKKENDSLSIIQLADSLFIDHNIKNYSLRLFTNYKVKQFRIKNGDFKSRYVPNNRYGLGVGFASSKVLIDLAFNVKTNKEEVTYRFDAQGTMIVRKRHYANVYI